MNVIFKKNNILKHIILTLLAFKSEETLIVGL